MRIGDQVRVVNVEPIVDPVPDGDFPGRPADVRPLVPRPTPRSGRRRRRRGGSSESVLVCADA